MARIGKMPDAQKKRLAEIEELAADEKAASKVRREHELKRLKEEAKGAIPGYVYEKGFQDALDTFKRDNFPKSKQGLALEAFKAGADLKSDLGDPDIRAAKAGYPDETPGTPEYNAKMGYAPVADTPAPEPDGTGGGGGFSQAEQRVYDERFAPRQANSGEGILGGMNYMSAKEGGAGGMSPEEQVASDRERAARAQGAGDAGTMGAGASPEMGAVAAPVPEAAPVSGPQPNPPPGMITVGMNNDGTYNYAAGTGEAAPSAAPSPAQVVERATGQKSTRMGGAWRNLPEDLRPEQLAGGLTIYPFERREYEARIQQAVQDGTVSPKVAKQVMAGYDKWKRTAWGAMVDYSRLKREEKHIGMEADADEQIIEERWARENQNLYSKLQKSQGEAQQAYEDERATYQESLAQTMAQQEAAIENLARREIDPERWWNSKSNGQKAMSAIGVALGSLGSGLTGIYGRGTPNTAYDMMKSAINRDVTAQMADMRNKRASVGARQSLMGTIMSQVKDAATAQTITKMALLDQAKSKINMYSAVATGDKARRNAEELITLVDNDREILAAELRMNAHKLAAARAAGVAAASRRQRQPGTLLGPELRKRFIEGEGLVIGGTPAQFQEMRAAFSGLNHGRSLTNEVTRIVDNPGYGTSLYRRQVAQNLVNAFNNKEIHELSGGAVPVDEAERMRSGGITDKGTGGIFDGIRNMWQRDPQGRLQMPIHNYLRSKELRVNELRSNFRIFPGNVTLGTFRHQKGNTAGINEVGTFFDNTAQPSGYGLEVSGKKGEHVESKPFWGGRKASPADVVPRK